MSAINTSRSDLPSYYIVFDTAIIITFVLFFLTLMSDIIATTTTFVTQTTRLISSVFTFSAQSHSPISTSPTTATDGRSCATSCCSRCARRQNRRRRKSQAVHRRARPHKFDIAEELPFSSALSAGTDYARLGAPLGAGEHDASSASGDAVQTDPAATNAAVDAATPDGAAQRKKAASLERARTRAAVELLFAPVSFPLKSTFEAARVAQRQVRASRVERRRLHKFRS